MQSTHSKRVCGRKASYFGNAQGNVGSLTRRGLNVGEQMLRSEQPFELERVVSRTSISSLSSTSAIPGDIQPFSGDVSMKYSALLLTAASVFGLRFLFLRKIAISI